MDTISNNTSQIASVRTVTSLNYIKKTYNIPLEDTKSFEKQISEDSKSTVISEQKSSQSNSALYNYQYQFNVPVSLLSTAGQTYNETTNPLAKTEKSLQQDESENSDYYVEESNDKNQKAGLGYYIIDKNIGTKSGRKSSQKLSNPMRDRLNKIYNLNFGIEPGTIVNVTCY